MADLAIQRLDDGAWDLVLYGDDLLVDDSLRPGIVVALLTDREYPAAEDRHGWWGDALLPDATDRDGSLIWRSIPGTSRAAAVADCKVAAEQALNWITADALADSVLVGASIDPLGTVEVDITVQRATGAERYRVQQMWSDSLAPSMPNRAWTTNHELNIAVVDAERVYFTLLPEAP